MEGCQRRAGPRATGANRGIVIGITTPLASTDRPAADRIRESLAAADRRRRGRDASRIVWRLAPGVAAAAALAALAGRWSGWPAPSALGVLIAGAGALSVLTYVLRRGAPVTDRLAASIDADASFGGEVRSASWFATADRRDEWSALHLERAASRLQNTSWADLYPSPATGRLKIATAVLAVATLAIAVAFPARPGAGLFARGVPGASTSATDVETSGDALVLSPELLKQIEALLADVEAGKVSGAAGAITAAQLRDLLARLSKAGGRAPQDAAARGAKGETGAKAPTAKDLEDVATRARRDAQMASNAPEIRDPLDALAQKLTDAAKKQDGGPQQGVAASSQGKDAKGAAAGQNAANAESGGQASMQMSKDAANSGGAGVIMMSRQDDPSAAAPGAGVGGGSGSKGSNNGTMPSIATALRRETLEASEDAAGQNIRTETHRQTEEGHANAAFSGATAATFDRGRAAASPAVPEERRAAVQTYFVRKP